MPELQVFAIPFLPFINKQNSISLAKYTYGTLELQLLQVQELLELY